MVNTLKKYREYVVLIAYGIVLADVVELIKDVTVEWLIHKRFNQLVQKQVEEVKEIDLDKSIEDYMNVAGDEKLPKND